MRLVRYYKREIVDHLVIFSIGPRSAQLKVRIKNYGSYTETAHEPGAGKPQRRQR